MHGDLDNRVVWNLALVNLRRKTGDEVRLNVGDRGLDRALDRRASADALSPAEETITRACSTGGRACAALVGDAGCGLSCVEENARRVISRVAGG